jgi:hypothetical protein
MGYCPIWRLLEILDDRINTGARHTFLGEPTLANAYADREVAWTAR